MLKMAGKETEGVLSFDHKRVKSKSVIWTVIRVLTMMSILTSLSLVILSAGIALIAIPIFVGLQILIAIIMSSLMRWFKLRQDHIRQIGYADDFTFVGSEKEEYVYRAMAEMCAKLKTPLPMVAIEHTDEVNAFAIGVSKKKSLIIFTSSMFEQMNEDEIIAIGAHELGHIQNGDMVGMTLANCMQLVLVNVISLPIKIIIYPLTAVISQYVGSAASTVVYTAICILIDYLLFGITNLFVLAYSRRREFRADLFAARIVGKDCMRRALINLTSSYSAPITKGVMGCHTVRCRFDIFSTHPSTARRINYVEKNSHF